MLLAHDNYRTYLKSELVARIGLNPSYSLRTFAGELGLSASGLSEVLSGKKNLSFSRALSLSRKLGHSNKETDYFVSLVQLASARKAEEKLQITQRIQNLNPDAQPKDLSVDCFAVISEWYHIPIMALTEVPNFRMSPRLIARRFGITPFEAELALKRLLRLELLEEVGRDRYRKLENHLRFKSPDINIALQHFHKQMFQRAIESLTTQTNQEKMVGSQTFAMNPQLLPAAKQRIEKFLTELMEFIDAGEDKREVYHFNFCLFNLKGK